jgi:hypothetical protein
MFVLPIACSWRRMWSGRASDRLAGRGLALDGVEETNEFEVAVRCMRRPIMLPHVTHRRTWQ